jgi:hypothetical protein
MNKGERKTPGSSALRALRGVQPFHVVTLADTALKIQGQESPKFGFQADIGVCGLQVDWRMGLAQWLFE